MAGRDVGTILDGRRIYPVTLVWGMLREECKVPVFLNEKVQLIEAFTLFAQYKAKEYLKRHTPSLASKGSYNSFIHEVAYSLKAFAEHLKVNKTEWEKVDDLSLQDFKERQFDSISSKPNSFSQETAFSTLNRKLRIIYEFYWWAQNVQLLVDDAIGIATSSRINSDIDLYLNDPFRYRKSKSMMDRVYPLCERVTGEKGKHRRQHYATLGELKKLRQYFRDNTNVYVAERNVLIVDIIDSVGWRGGSISSLTTAQFSDSAINDAFEGASGFLPVTPSIQKRGYSKEFDVPLQLAIRINRYIKDVHKKMSLNCQNGGSSDKQMLFINVRTGRGLTPKTISRIISDGFKAIGVKGHRVGPHSIRRKYGKEKSCEIIETRKRLGISTDPKDVMLDLAGFLGHSSLAAQNAYNAGKRDIYSDSVEKQLQERVSKLESTISSYRLEIEKKNHYINDLEKLVSDKDDKA